MWLGWGECEGAGSVVGDAIGEGMNGGATSQVGPLCGTLALILSSAGSRQRAFSTEETRSDLHCNKITLSAVLEMDCSIECGSRVTT